MRRFAALLLDLESDDPLRGIQRRSGSARRLLAQFQPGRARLGSEVSRDPRSRQFERVHASHERAPSPRRLALRQRQCRMDSRPLQGMGTRRPHRNLRRSLPHAQGPRARNGRAHQVHREARRARSGRRSNLKSKVGAATHLQRLLDRRRRHCSSGLRELRAARRLRKARSPGHLGKGRNRDREVLPVLARCEAQGRGRARRDRMPHLFRTKRRRLHPRRRFPARPHAQSRRRAARQRHGFRFGQSRRSAHAWHWCHTRGEAAVAEGSKEHHQDSRSADLLRRCAALAGRS